jgi:hypothetical protein
MQTYCSFPRVLFIIGISVWLTACGGGGSDDSDDGDATTTSTTASTRIWFVDNRNSGGTGAADDPFAALADAQLAAEDGDIIYIANGDGTTTGLDAGLILAAANISVIGEGVALVVDGATLATAGIAPKITNPAGAGITLNTADNTLIKGLIIDSVSGDGLVVNDSTGVTLEEVTISNSGESAIEGSGADVELTLTNVTIDTVDAADPTVSDDAVRIAATTSSSLVMSGGSIDGVPGKLGNGIELENVDAANPVAMSLDVRGVSFSNIGQDGIKLDNNNGVAKVQIGGATAVDGNNFDVGFRGIKIRTAADPTLNRTNTILIQNNDISSSKEGVQIRNAADTTNLRILDNILNRGPAAGSSDLVDLQAELMANTQARINRNSINNSTGSDGVKIRVFDAATVTMEALDNTIDGPVEGFDFDVIESNPPSMSNTTLNASVLNTALVNIGGQAMNARNASATSDICLDLQGNTEPNTFAMDVAAGSFELTAASQTVLFVGGSSGGSGPCPVPVF